MFLTDSINRLHDMKKEHLRECACARVTVCMCVILSDADRHAATGEVAAD